MPRPDVDERIGRAEIHGHVAGTELVSEVRTPIATPWVGNGSSGVSFMIGADGLTSKTRSRGGRKWRPLHPPTRTAHPLGHVNAVELVTEATKATSFRPGAHVTPVRNRPGAGSACTVA